MTEEVSYAIKRFQEEMSSVDDLVHVLLKGHLLIEEALTRILELYLFYPEHLTDARLTFNQKALLCRALCLRKNQKGEWELISSLNSLRNELAHKLRSPEREKRLQRVKQIFFREIAEFNNIEAVKKQSDSNIIMAACAECAGFLASFEGDSKEFRKIIYTIDEELNPDSPRFQL
jgi:hypothetical protein